MDYSYIVSKLNDVKESELVKDNFKFNLFNTISNISNGNFYLIVGYSEDFYLLLRLGANFQIVKYPKGEVERLCSLVNKSNLPKIEKGDKVLCVAKGRYAGVAAGEVREVVDVIDDRIQIGPSARVTHDPIYFVVVEKAKKPIVDTSGSNSSGPTKISYGVYDSSTHRMVKHFDGTVEVPVISRKSYIDDSIKKRAIVEASPVIRRKVVIEPDIRRRTTVCPIIIRKTK